MEVGQLLPKIVSEKVNRENTIVLCLGHGNMTKEEIIELCKKNDTKKDWSYDVSLEQLDIHAQKWYETNEICKRDCSKYNIKYIDTSKDREKILNEIMDQISREA